MQRREVPEDGIPRKCNRWAPENKVLTAQLTPSAKGTMSVSARGLDPFGDLAMLSVLPSDGNRDSRCAIAADGDPNEQGPSAALWDGGGCVALILNVMCPYACQQQVLLLHKPLAIVWQYLGRWRFPGRYRSTGQPIVSAYCLYRWARWKSLLRGVHHGWGT